MTRRTLPTGTTVQVAAVPLLSGEVMYDTTAQRLRVGDGATAGGRVVDSNLESRLNSPIGAGIVLTAAGIPVETALANVPTTSTLAQLEASASAAADRAEAASIAGGGSYPSDAADHVPVGVNGSTSLVAGSGGANGTFALAFTGGNFLYPPSGTFTVAGGVVTAINITGPGLYIGASPTAPTPVFSASSGLTGASATLTTDYLIGSGKSYRVQTEDGNNLDLYYNNAGTPQVSDPLDRIPQTSYVVDQVASISSSNFATELPLTLATSAPATKITEASGTGTSPSVYRNYTGFVSGVSYVFEVIAKAGERSFLSLFCNRAALFQAVFDLSGGTVVSEATGTAATIVALGNGWYLCRAVVTATADGDLDTNNVQTRVGSGPTTFTYTGDGTSGLQVASIRLYQSGTTADLLPSRLPTDASFTKQGCTVAADVSSAVPIVPRVESLEAQLSGVHPAKTTEASGANQSPSVYRSIDFTNGVVYRAWALARRAEYKTLNIYDNSVNLGNNGVFDLEAGTCTGAGASMSFAGDGVWLCQVERTATATSSINLQLRIFPDGGSNPHTGDGVSGIYLLGAGWDEAGSPIVDNDPAAIVSSLWTKQNVTVAIDDDLAVGSVVDRLTALEGGTNPVSPLQGKKWAALGSSITAQGHYVNQLAAMTGMVLTNLGIGGAALGLDARSSPHYGSGVIYGEIESIPADTEIVTLESGPNDFADTASAVPLGALGDTTTATYYGALYAALVAIKAQVPNAKIVLINAYGSDPTQMPNYSATHINVNGNTLAQFQQAVEDVANMFGVRFIDVGRQGGLGLLNTNTSTGNTADGLHITDQGGRYHAGYDYERLLDFFADGYFS